MASIFTRIVNGEIPAARVYEDEHTLAFMDINPATRGHILVICKQEHADLFSIAPETLAAVAHTTQRVARAIQTVLRPDGLNIVQNNGAAAGQTVFHYHVHLIPRWEGDNALPLWRPQQADTQDVRDLAQQIGRAASGE
ncbi:MAG TPA: HIT family protein [Roseiflexaceae bacterium]|nr:HIT family protein [Roseiflexaceae bacterium]